MERGHIPTAPSPSRPHFSSNSSFKNPSLPGAHTHVDSGLKTPPDQYLVLRGELESRLTFHFIPKISSLALCTSGQQSLRDSRANLLGDSTSGNQVPGLSAENKELTQDSKCKRKPQPCRGLAQPAPLLLSPELGLEVPAPCLSPQRRLQEALYEQCKRRY